MTALYFIAKMHDKIQKLRNCNVDIEKCLNVCYHWRVLGCINSHYWLLQNCDESKQYALCIIGRGWGWGWGHDKVRVCKTTWSSSRLSKLYRFNVCPGWCNYLKFRDLYEWTLMRIYGAVSRIITGGEFMLLTWKPVGSRLSWYLGMLQGS